MHDSVDLQERQPDLLKEFLADYAVSAQGAGEADALGGASTSGGGRPRYEALIPHYSSLWREIAIRLPKITVVDQIVDDVVENRERYQTVEIATTVPWYVIAIIHSLEASLNFKTHLHNGDPLTDFTVHVPAGRPARGSPPFKWEDSAIDALVFDRLANIRSWPIERILYSLEGFNGFGYLLHHPEVKSPYVWSFSNHYVKGKYVADRVWSPDAVSRQCGGAVILRRLIDRGIIEEPISSEPAIAAAGGGNYIGVALLSLAASRIGEEYDLGADVSLDDREWHGPWDCAEFVSWAVYQATGQVLGCVDNEAPMKRLEPYSGAWYRDAKASPNRLPIERAANVAGSVLVRKPREGKIGHVAISDGDGGTIEAAGSALGVCRRSIKGRVWDVALQINNSTLS